MTYDEFLLKLFNDKRVQNVSLPELSMVASSSFDILCGRENDANGSGRSCTDSY